MFAWITMGPKERADWVREHRKFSIADLPKVFNLTEDGVIAILKGDDWRPEYVACKRPVEEE